jgi:hypothetical protein
MPNRPSPASESGVLRVDGAAATPSRSPNGYEIGHGMGKTWGSVGSAYDIGGARRGRVRGMGSSIARCLGESERIRWSALRVDRGDG